MAVGTRCPFPRQPGKGQGRRGAEEARRRGQGSSNLPAGGRGMLVLPREVCGVCSLRVPEIPPNPARGLKIALLA